VSTHCQSPTSETVWTADPNAGPVSNSVKNGEAKLECTLAKLGSAQVSDQEDR
jgi:hypothetical protein